MPRVVLLTSVREPGGPAAVLPAHLPRERFWFHSAELIPGHVRSWTQATGQLVSQAPHVIHAVGWPAAGVALAVQKLPRRGGAPKPRVVITPSSVWPKVAGRAVRWMVRRADALAARTEAERAWLIAAGAEPGRLRVVPPAAPEVRDGDTLPEASADGPLIVALGEFDTHVGLSTAAWAFDVLKYPESGARLVMLGDGPERARTERFARRVGYDDLRTSFAPRPADAAGWLAAADLVWVAAARGAVGHALRGLARPVPCVLAVPESARELVADDDSARAVPAGDRVGLAAAARELLARRRELAGAAERRAGAIRARFSPEAVAARLAALYDELAIL